MLVNAAGRFDEVPEGQQAPAVPVATEGQQSLWTGLVAQGAPAPWTRYNLTGGQARPGQTRLANKKASGACSAGAPLCIAPHLQRGGALPRIRARVSSSLSALFAPCAD